MNSQTILLIFVGVVGLASLGLLVYLFLSQSSSSSDIKNLMSSHRDSSTGTAKEVRDVLKKDTSGKEYEVLKEQTRKKISKTAVTSIEEQFFRAGIFSDSQKTEFRRLQIIIPIIAVPLTVFLMYSYSPSLMLPVVLLMAFMSYRAPSFLLDSRIRTRNDEILYYLPLVIEQISIGVSSSLDTGPCLQRIVQMADERDTHNPVSELIRHAQYYIKSGASLDDALLEVAKLSGHTELKHTFLALSQVAKHGGEVTRQLQELADSVTSQREAKIEGKIKRLELEATAPVAVVFVGFFIMLLVIFTTQLKNSF